MLKGTWHLKFGKLLPRHIAFHTLWFMETLRSGKDKLFFLGKGGAAGELANVHLSPLSESWEQAVRRPVDRLRKEKFLLHG